MMFLSEKLCFLSDKNCRTSLSEVILRNSSLSSWTTFRKTSTIMNDLSQDTPVAPHESRFITAISKKLSNSLKHCSWWVYNLFSYDCGINSAP